MQENDANETIDKRYGLLGIQPGTELAVQVVGTEVRARSKLVGFETGSYLVMRTPRQGTKPLIIRPGTDLIVRYLVEGSAWGFHCKVVDEVFTPVPLMLLTYPEVVERFDLRKYERASCAIPSEGKFGAGNLTGIIVDLSAGGCRFVCDAPKGATILMDDPIQLEFIVPGGTVPEICVGQIKNVIQDSDKIAIGVQFDQLSIDSIGRIEDFVGKTRKLEGVKPT